VTLFVGHAGSLKRQRASQAAGFAALTIAVMALIGWWAGLPLLSSWSSGLAGMKPLTALCLAALGVALMRPGKDLRFAFAVGLAVAAVAVLDLVRYMFGIEPGIGSLQTSRTAVLGERAAWFAMPHVTALGLALAGGSLALSRFERHGLTATVFGSLAGAIGASVVFGYLTGVALYGPASVNAPALPTAIGLLFVTAGIMLRIGAMPALRKPRPLRHLLVILGCAIVAPLLLFGIYAGNRIADAQLDQIRSGLVSEARTISAHVDREIIGEIETMQALAASPSLRQGDFAEFQRQAEASLAVRQSGRILLIDRNVQQLVNTRMPFGTPLGKAAVPEAVERALATGRPQVTGLFMERDQTAHVRHHRARADRWREPLRPRQVPRSSRPRRPRHRKRAAARLEGSRFRRRAPHHRAVPSA
jgi:hypothetical protein